MWTFRAMGTDVNVATPGIDDQLEETLVRDVETVFADVEGRFSRFDPESELGRLNRSVGPHPVSSEMLDLLDAARHHVDDTGGLFDPAIGGALEAAGYDRSFVAGELDRDESLPPPRRAAFHELVIDRVAGTVTRPPHLHLDLGGFLKGRTADRAAALLPACAMVDAGGDAVLRGRGPDGQGWEVDVEDPADADRVLLTLRVSDRAIATSSPNRRHWRAGDVVAHHLIDPRTAQPADHTLAQVTALAPTAEKADVLAKVAFLLGPLAGARLLSRPGVGGVLVHRDGRIDTVGEVALAVTAAQAWRCGDA